MCIIISIIEVESSQCENIGYDSEAHKWHEYTYTACENGRRRPCDDQRAFDSRSYTVIPTVRLRECHVCAGLKEADGVRKKAIDEAERKYARAVAEAEEEHTAACALTTRDYRRVNSQEPVPSSSKHEGAHERRRHRH